MKRIIVWLFIIGMIAAIAAFAYIKFFSAKHADPSKSQQISLSAIELYWMFSNYEDSANKLYAVRDKAINVGGRIDQIEKENGRYTITLYSGSDMGGVVCEMDSIENQQIQGFKSSDSVNIVGFCNGYLMDVQLFRCKLAK